MKTRTTHILLIACTIVLGAAALLLLGVGGYWYATEYATTTTSSTTTTSTTSTTTTSTTTTTTTTSTTTTTTTLTTFYVCDKTVSESTMVQTLCYGKQAKEYRNTTLKADVTYALSNALQNQYGDYTARVDGDTCQYTSSKVAISVGSMLSCEIPKDVKYTCKARLVVEE